VIVTGKSVDFFNKKTRPSNQPHILQARLANSRDFSNADS
jgi:hypothetical protein